MSQYRKHRVETEIYNITKITEQSVPNFAYDKIKSQSYSPHQFELHRFKLAYQTIEKYSCKGEVSYIFEYISVFLDGSI